MAKQATRYRYFLYYKTYQDESLHGDGRAESVMMQPIAGIVDLAPIEADINRSLRPGYRSMITNYRLMARFIDGEWISTDA